jgi:hypothetical protein
MRTIFEWLMVSAFIIAMTGAGAGFAWASVALVEWLNLPPSISPYAVTILAVGSIVFAFSAGKMLHKRITTCASSV